MNTDIIQKKIQFLRSMENLRSTKPDMPVHIAIQEAFDLYEYCQKDREILIKGGIDWHVVEDLPVRANALIELQALWETERKTPDEDIELWKEKFAKAYEVRRELLHNYLHVFEFNRDIRERIREICKGQGIPDFIQSLSSLAELGHDHREILQDRLDDLSLVDQAREMGEQLPRFYSKAVTARREGKGGTVPRNRAFYHLRESVDQVRRTGRFIFWKNKERYRGYVSRFIQLKKQKRQ